MVRREIFKSEKYTQTVTSPPWTASYNVFQTSQPLNTAMKVEVVAEPAEELRRRIETSKKVEVKKENDKTKMKNNTAQKHTDNIDTLGENVDNEPGTLKSFISNIKRKKELDKFFIEKFVAGDGNCMFMSICGALELNVGLDMELRNLACDCLSKLAGDERKIIEEIEGKDLDVYVREMRNRKQWGTGVELEALAKELETLFVLFTYDENKNTLDNSYIGSSENAKSVAFLIFYTNTGMKSSRDEGNHYQYLIPKEHVKKLIIGEYGQGDARRINKLLVEKARDTYADEGLNTSINEPFNLDPIVEENKKTTLEENKRQECDSPVKKVTAKTRKKDNKAANNKNKKKPGKKMNAEINLEDLFDINEEECKAEEETINASRVDPEPQKEVSEEEKIKSHTFDTKFEFIKPIKQGRTTGYHIDKDIAKCGDDNRSLTQENQVDIVEKLASTTKFKDIVHLMSKREIDKKGLENVYRSLPKNIVFDTDVLTKHIKGKFEIPDKMLRRIPFVVCFLCSGRTKRDNKPSYRLYNDFHDFKEHCSRADSKDYAKVLITKGARGHSNNEGSVIPRGSVINLDMENFRAIQIQEGRYHALHVDDMKRTGAGRTVDETVVTAYGWNCRTAASPANQECIRNFLDKVNPDFLILNECRKINKRVVIGKSHRMIENGGGKVAILYSARHSVHPILQEMCDDYNVICKCNSEKKSVIVYGVYVPPDSEHKNRLIELAHRLRIIRQKYAELQLILFGDLNILRKDLEKEFESVRALGFKLWYQKGECAFTRMEGEKMSYLDYFITYGVEDANLEIQKPIGLSDHWTVQLRINTRLSELKLRRELVTDFSKPKKDSKEIAEALLKVFSGDDLIELVTGLQVKYKPRVRKVKSAYQLREAVRKALVSGNNKWEMFNKMCKKANSDDFNAFMSTLKDLDMNNRYKEYFHRIRFYTEIGRNQDILRELMIEGDLVVDKTEVSRLVTKRYKELLADNGAKRFYVHGSAIEVSEEDVVEAIANLPSDKAVSWDMIPSGVLKVIAEWVKTEKEKYKRVIETLVNVLNSLLKRDMLPMELFTARLVCLNKEADKRGTLDTIRPIAVTGLINKILEFAVLRRIMDFVYDENGKVRPAVMSKDQIGFVKGAGTDVNILKLLVRCREAKEWLRGTKVVLFIDLKKAYDSVIHEFLFIKLFNKGFDECVINTIKKLYSSAWIQVDSLSDRMSVNRGVLQGSLISPLLFNIYIDDLVVSLKENAFDVLAYADDIAIIADRYQLDKCIDILDEWSLNNGIAINRKKSGIIVFDRVPDLCEDRCYREYPIVDMYRYLGVYVNERLTLEFQATTGGNKLQKYVDRNRFLIRKYFSPRSLIKIFNYYQKSRLVYGMSSDLIHMNSIRRLNTNIMKLIKNILGLASGTRNTRLLLTLAVPNLASRLIIQLLKNLKKLRIFFDLDTRVFDKVVKGILGESWFSKWRQGEGFSLSELGKHLDSIDMKEYAKDVGVEVSDNYHEVVRKEWYKYYDRRDFYVLKYFCNRGFFKEDSCEYCGAAGSREHFVDLCEHFIDKREISKGSIRKTCWREEFFGKKLSEMLDLLYFMPSSDKKTRRAEMKVIKETIARIFWRDD